MFFNQFLTRFLPHTGDPPSRRKDTTNRRGESATQKISARPLFQASRNLNTTSEINNALEEVDKAIQNGTATNQQLLIKAELLIRKEKFRKARELLTKISNNKIDQEVADEAMHLQEFVPHLQEEASTNRLKRLLGDLHRIAQKYETKLLSLPPIKDLTPDLDITQSIREDARLARTADLPGLSLELIERTLQSGQESLWLLHDKAISLSMMGQQSTALDILSSLKETTQKENLTNSIKKNINIIKGNSNSHRIKLNIYLAKQSKIFIKSQGFDTAFIPEANKINEKTRIKFIIFKKARAVLPESPKACLSLVNSILDYFQGDLAALQLKGEALAALQRNNEAIQIWKGLTQSKDDTIAKRAAKLITQCVAKEAKLISRNQSTEAALSYFIQEHLKLKLAPTLNNDITDVIKKHEPSNTKDSHPELQKHQFQLQLNTMAIEFLEDQLLKQDRLGANEPTQKSVAIKKDARKKD
ncbi:hypothetical protein N8463_01820 [Synechococcus sp. AH-601-P06]|nr:hypothetical protein [Synechococcus sp. AH-601-P06]